MQTKKPLPLRESSVTDVYRLLPRNCLDKSNDACDMKMPADAQVGRAGLRRMSCPRARHIPKAEHTSGHCTAVAGLTAKSFPAKVTCLVCGPPLSVVGHGLSRDTSSWALMNSLHSCVHFGNRRGTSYPDKTLSRVTGAVAESAVTKDAFNTNAKVNWQRQGRTSAHCYM